MMIQILDNYLNGNITDAKRLFDESKLNLGHVLEYGLELNYINKNGLILFVTRMSA